MPSSSPASADDATAPAALGTALVALMPRLTRLVVADLHRAPPAEGITLAQFRALCRLAERDDYQPATLAAALDVGRPTISATLDGLVRRGLVERQRGSATDGRAVLLRLTADGRAVQAALHQRAVGVLERLLGDAAPEDRAALAQGLALLSRRLDADDIDDSNSDTGSAKR